MQLAELGFGEPFKTAFDAMDDGTLVAARVSAEHKGSLELLAEGRNLRARPSGRLRHHAQGPEDLPAVGDWVAVRPLADGGGTIEAVLPRRTLLLRRRAERAASAQVIASNLDTVFLLCSLNRDFNLRRLERYIALVWESGAQPVVLLSKADLCPDASGYREAAMGLAVGVPVHALSALTGEGLAALAPYLAPAKTIALLGSSGAGKSTLLNALLGQTSQRTSEIRHSDGRGRHTTTFRQLVPLPDGALVIDTPGMRELGLWDAATGLDATFEEVEAWTRDCRFADCRHESEPGCAVQRALETGQLDPNRLANYQKLQRELAYLERQRDAQARLAHAQAERRIWKVRRKATRQRLRRRES